MNANALFMALGLLLHLWSYIEAGKFLSFSLMHMQKVEEKL